MKLVIPRPEDMDFRQKLLEDEDTMAYNRKWGGTIPFPKDKWQNWYAKWVLSPVNMRFYRYIADENNGFVGEAAYYYDENRGLYIASVVIMAKYRGQGYGSQGLYLLCEAAKQNGIACLYDDIAIDNPAFRLFLKNGFHEEYRTADYIMVKKSL